jgi:hypothetical protein
MLALALFRFAPSLVSAQIHVDYQEPPASLNALFEKVDAVVLVRIAGRTELLNGYGRPVTDYRVIVLEKFKGDGSIPSKGPGLTVRRTGGLRKENAEVDFPVFESGDQYVLFLHYRRDLEGLTPAYGPDGAIRLDSNGVLMPLGYRAAQKYKNQSANELLEALRQLGR